MKYKVEFQFYYGMGRWADDDFTNNGNGFDKEDAEHIAYQIKMQGHRNVKVVKMEGEKVIA